MQIDNETCYNTEDLVAIINKVREVITAIPDQPYTYENPPRVRVGYYSPKRTTEGDEEFDKEGREHYVRVTKPWRGIPRIAIVKKQHLPLSPLQQLATTTSDEMYVPDKVVRQLIRGVAHDLFGAWASRSDGVEVEEAKLRYKARAKRGALVNAKRSAMQDRLRRAEQRRHWDLEALKSTEEKLVKLREKIAKAAIRIEKMQRALRG